MTKSIYSSVVFFLLTASCAMAETKYIHTDYLGSVVAVSDESGNVLQRTHYTPFGAPDSPEIQDNKASFTGHVFDDESDLVYMQARYYDPVIGRFYSNDPLGYRGVLSFNRYAYANNNPFSYIDPDGKDAVHIVYENYEVDTGLGFKAPLGHAGVLLIDNKTGFTKYYEYGRYHPDSSSRGKTIIGRKLPTFDGNIRNVSVPNAVLDENGTPTAESLEAIYSHLSRVAGQNKEVNATYHKGLDFATMEKYVNDLANNKNRETYSIPLCTCYSFANDVIDSAKSRRRLAGSTRRGLRDRQLNM